MGRRKYDPTKVLVEHKGERSSSWRWYETTRGVEHTYEVTDGNFDRLNRWAFIVQVPSEPGSIIVKPLQVPDKKAFAGLAGVSIVLPKATKHPYRAELYCKVNLADPTREKSRVGTRRGQRSKLPKWFDYFSRDMRLKNTVATTAGHDGQAQVVLVPKDDHEQMIRLFFALRVWVLQEGVTIS